MASDSYAEKLWRNKIQIEIVIDHSIYLLSGKNQLTAAQHRNIHEATPSNDPRVCYIRDLQQLIVSAFRGIPNNRRIHNTIETLLDRVRPQWHRPLNPSHLFRSCDENAEIDSRKKKQRKLKLMKCIHRYISTDKHRMKCGFDSI